MVGKEGYNEDSESQRQGWRRDRRRQESDSCSDLNFLFCRVEFQKTLLWGLSEGLMIAHDTAECLIGECSVSG